MFPSTSTPPKVSPFPCCFPFVVCFERESDGPGSSFGSQWSPTFSKLCLSDAYAVRCARSPSPYCSTAESWVFA